MYKINIKQLFLFLFISLIAISCDDDHDHDHEGHTDAEGFVLENDGNIIYRQFEGAVTIDNLILYENEILDLSVHFLDHDGNEIEHEDEEGEEESLSFDITNPDIISIIVEDHEEEGEHDHDEEHHVLGFELEGIGSGTTTFTLSLMHQGHADFVSLPISVTVNPVMFSCSGKQLCLNNCCSTMIYATK